MIELSGNVNLALCEGEAYHQQDIGELLGSRTELWEELDIYGFETGSQGPDDDGVPVERLDEITAQTLIKNGWRTFCYMGRFIKLSEPAENGTEIQQTLSPVFGLASHLVVVQPLHKSSHLAAKIDAKGNKFLFSLDAVWPWPEHYWGDFTNSATALPVIGLHTQEDTWLDLTRIKDGFDQTVQHAIAAGALQNSVDTYSP